MFGEQVLLFGTRSLIKEMLSHLRESFKLISSNASRVGK